MDGCKVQEKEEKRKRGKKKKGKKTKKKNQKNGGKVVFNFHFQTCELETIILKKEINSDYLQCCKY